MSPQIAKKIFEGHGVEKDFRVDVGRSFASQGELGGKRRPLGHPPALRQAVLQALVLGVCLKPRPRAAQRLQCRSWLLRCQRHREHAINVAYLCGAQRRADGLRMLAET